MLARKPENNHKPKRLKVALTTTLYSTVGPKPKLLNPRKEPFEGTLSTKPSKKSKSKQASTQNPKPKKGTQWHSHNGSLQRTRSASKSPGATDGSQACPGFYGGL